jgi:hypothetical protein
MKVWRRRGERNVASLGELCRKNSSRYLYQRLRISWDACLRQSRKGGFKGVSGVKRPRVKFAGREDFEGTRASSRSSGTARLLLTC